MIIEPELTEAIGRREATISHDLAQHRDLEPARLVALGTQLPASWRLSYDALGKPMPFDVEEMLGRLQNGPCGLRLYHLEFLSEFASVIRRCYEGAGEGEAAAAEGGVVSESSIIFIASPGARTRAHLDHHHNLLLQIFGTKRLTVARFSPPERQRLEVERGFAAMGACTSTPTETVDYVMRPGDGIYLPPYSFHSAEVLDGGISVALSCAFSTPATQRHYRVHVANLALRRLRIEPTPLGTSATGDAVKNWLGRGLQRLRPVRT